MNDSQKKHFLHLFCGDSERLIHASEVIEVIPMVQLRKEDDDKSDPHYSGLLDYRGQVIPVFNLPGEDPEYLDPANFIVITRKNDEYASVIASDVDDLIEIAQSDISTVRLTGDREIEVGKLDGRVVKILSPSEYFR